MTTTPAKPTVPPIKVMGDFPDIRDTIHCLPQRKGHGYVYLILGAHFLLKVGRSNQIANRIKTHEHGLRTYGFNRIVYAAVSNPTPDDSEIEANVKARFASELKGKALTSEWFRTHETAKALRIFTECLDGHPFAKVTGCTSAGDAVAAKLDRYFRAFPDRDHGEFSYEMLIAQLREEAPGRFPSDGRARAVIAKLALANPDCITATPSGISVSRSVLETDLFYQPDRADGDFYRSLAKPSNDEAEEAEEAA